MNRPISTREQLLERVDELQAELATAKPLADAMRSLKQTCEAIIDANCGKDVPRDEALNSFIATHARLTAELATAKRDAERYRAALAKLFHAGNEYITSVDNDNDEWEQARATAIEALALNHTTTGT